jgi:hypothetical protein
MGFDPGSEDGPEPLDPPAAEGPPVDVSGDTVPPWTVVEVVGPLPR